MRVGQHASCLICLQDKQKLFRLLKTLNGEARERKQSAHRNSGGPGHANGAGKLDIQADGGLLDLDAHDGDLLAHVSGLT
jgi:hypothetical protein